MIVLAAMGCSGGGLQPTEPVAGLDQGLLIEELYYAGAEPTGGTDRSSSKPAPRPPTP